MTYDLLSFTSMNVSGTGTNIWIYFGSYKGQAVTKT